MTTLEADPSVLAELAPTGTLRAAINIGNFLLVTDRANNGDPVGVSPAVAAEIATRLVDEVLGLPGRAVRQRQVDRPVVER